MHKYYATYSMLPTVKRAISIFKRLFFCASFIFLSLSWQNVHSDELPDLGNSSTSALNATQERELGLSIMKQLKAALMVSQDVIINEYLEELGYRLIATQGQAQPNYHFFAVKDKTINAFALPGGFVGINTGLIVATESESELAGVVAHEIGHVQQRHIARMYEHMGRLRISTIAGLIASIIIATQNPQAGSGAMAATLAGSQQALINYTRDHEKEADYVGIETLAKAGFDPMGMPTFFHRMYQDTRFYGNHIPEYLMTHPLTESRLMTAQMRAKNFPYRQVVDTLQYHLVQARVIAHGFPTAFEASNYFAKILKRGNYRSRPGTLYGYALALIEQGKPAEAKIYLDELVSTYPDQPLFQLVYAQMEFLNGQKTTALTRLAQTLKNHPNNYPIIFSYGEWLVRSGETQTAITLLKQQVMQKPIHPELWTLLSAAYAQERQGAQAHLAQAQYLKLQGDLNSAMTQLKLAKKIATLTHQEKTQIDAQMKDIQLKLDAKKK